MSTLVKMAVFSSFFMEWDEIGAVVKCNNDDKSVVDNLNLVMPYTAEEECWINEQVRATLIKTISRIMTSLLGLIHTRHFCDKKIILSHGCLKANQGKLLTKHRVP